ncbi:MAG: hypothetical protein WCG96_12135, partial [Actinomycetes bacterium]
VVGRGGAQSSSWAQWYDEKSFGWRLLIGRDRPPQPWAHNDRSSPASRGDRIPAPGEHQKVRLLDRHAIQNPQLLADSLEEDGHCVDLDAP